MPFGLEDLIPLGMGILESEGASDANDANRELFYQNQAWQEHMRSTAHQTEVKDLIQAGLNPMLSVNKGAAMGSVGQAPKMENEVAAGMAGAQQAASIQLLKAQTEKTRNEARVAHSMIGRTEADTLKILTGEIPDLTQRAVTGEYSAANLNASTGYINHQARRIQDEIEKLRAEKRNIDSHTAQRQFELRHIMPLEEQLHELEVVSRHFDNTIKFPEAQWARRTGEFRPAAKDLIPAINSASRFNQLNPRPRANITNNFRR